MKFAQPLSQLIYHLLDMAGDKLVVCYKKAFFNLLQQLKNNWLPKYEAYTDDLQNGMYTEPMNKLQYLEIDAAAQRDQNTLPDGRNIFNTGINKA